MQRVGGVAFLVVVGLLVALTVAIYQKAFTPVVRVTLQADRIGNQLTIGADVKVRGLVVGEVRSVRTTGDGATLELALNPSMPVPADVTAQLLPKTLFGEKFVSLVPGRAAGPSLEAGDVITQDHSRTALETETALNDLLPVLRALKPQELSMTLNALSGALRGRGDRIGATLARTGGYLAELNPQLPTLRTDMAELGVVAHDYSAALPDLVRVLDNLSANSRSLGTEQGALHSFLTDNRTFAASADSLLRQDQGRFVALARDSLPSLAVYAERSPDYPCLFTSLVAAEKVTEDTFGGLQPGLHITLEPVQDNGAYVPGQEPRYGDTGRGTFCHGLDPQHPIRPLTADYNPTDGYMDGQEVDPTTGRAPCTHRPCAEPPPGAGGRTETSGGAAERSALKAMIGPVTGTAPAEVPDLAALLLAPVVHGTTISLA